MRPIILSNIKPSEPGAFKRIEPGVYPCIIKKVEDHPQAEYLTLVLDIVAGEYEGFFSTDYYADKPYAHSITLFYGNDRSINELAWSMLKIGESNTGFDVDAMLKAGAYQLLENKVCGCIFAYTEFFNSKTEEFEIGNNAQPKKLCSTADIQAGTYADATDPIMLSRNGKLKQIKKRLNMGDVDAERWLNAYESRKECKENVPAIPSTVPAGTYDGPLPFM